MDPYLWRCDFLLAPADFGLTKIMIPNKWYQSIGHEFNTHPTHVGEDIVGNWMKQCSMCVSQHGLTASHGSLSLVMWLLTDTCKFWFNDNHDSQQVVSKRRSWVRYTTDSRWGGYCWTLDKPTFPIFFTTWNNRLSWILISGDVTVD